MRRLIGLESGPQQPGPARQRAARAVSTHSFAGGNISRPLYGEDDGATRSSSAARSTLPRGVSGSASTNTIVPRDLVRRQPRAAEPRATSSTPDLCGRIGDDAGDDLLAAARVGRGRPRGRRATPGHDRAAPLRLRPGCTLRPATFTNDEARPTSVSRRCSSSSARSRRSEIRRRRSRRRVPSDSRRRPRRSARGCGLGAGRDCSIVP